MPSTNCINTVTLAASVIAVAASSSAFALAPTTLRPSSSLLSPPARSHRPASRTDLNMATFSPSDGDGTVGVIGRGFISVLAAKLAAIRGYDTWFICPPGEDETIRSLISEDGVLPTNLELVPASDSDALESRVRTMKALLVAVDDPSTMDESVIDYLLDPAVATNGVRRVVGMSRNLNGRGMGFLVKASKISANSDVWDCSNAADFEKFEAALRKRAKDLGAEYTIARAGTLKGGACGEDAFPQYLSRKFYELTKKDIVTWNLLFDCNVRGVTISKGDVLPGPGGKAVFTATSAEVCDGDTSRCGMAEAMVRSLEVEGAGDADFGVGTAESREPPSDTEWATLFSVL